ncbi:hypothetical protein TRFO_37636 [Tritrichomonas foetus]|uniref:HECT-type E3 ubiquitin transferase n=1 Tax=Tritrichomonas foetus TaxID=1144522 RepID=A0A1J4JAP4_9EUKA|nr:hypothetical protein TRFO_37636 [Tritrichomonas foetus]|eukprot:OHS96224.1 hypothetical protein TRFO_37636 [Tritrichomonas foetus]
MNSLLFPSSPIFENATFEDNIIQSLIDIDSDPPPEEDLIFVFENGLKELSNNHNLATTELIMYLLIKIERKCPKADEILTKYLSNKPIHVNISVLAIMCGKNIDFDENCEISDVASLFIKSNLYFNQTEITPEKVENMNKMILGNDPICSEIALKLTKQGNLRLKPENLNETVLLSSPSLLCAISDGIDNEETFNKFRRPLYNAIMPRRDSHAASTFLKLCSDFGRGEIKESEIINLLEFVDQPINYIQSKTLQFIASLGYKCGSKFGSKLEDFLFHDGINESTEEELINSAKNAFLHIHPRPLATTSIPRYISLLNEVGDEPNQYECLFFESNAIKDDGLRTFQFWQKYLTKLNNNPNFAQLEKASSIFVNSFSFAISNFNQTQTTNENSQPNTNQNDAENNGFVDYQKMMMEFIFNFIKEYSLISETVCNFVYFVWQQNSSLIKLFNESDEISYLLEENNHFPFYFWKIFPGIFKISDFGWKYSCIQGMAKVLINKPREKIPPLELMIFQQDDQSNEIIKDFLDNHCKNMDTVFDFYTDNENTFSLISCATLFAITYSRTEEVVYNNIEQCSAAFFLVAFHIMELLGEITTKTITQFYDCKLFENFGYEILFYSNTNQTESFISLTPFISYVIQNYISFILRHRDFFTISKVGQVIAGLFSLLWSNEFIAGNQSNFEKEFLCQYFHFYLYIPNVTKDEIILNLISTAAKYVIPFLYDHAIELTHYFNAIVDLKNINNQMLENEIYSKSFDLMNFIQEKSQNDFSLNYIYFVQKFFNKNELYIFNDILEAELDKQINENGIDEFKYIIQYFMKYKSVESNKSQLVKDENENALKDIDLSKYIVHENMTHDLLLSILNYVSSKQLQKEHFPIIFQKLKPFGLKEISILNDIFFDENMLVNMFRISIEQTELYKQFSITIDSIANDFSLEFRDHPSELCMALNETFVRPNDDRSTFIKRAETYPLRPIDSKKVDFVKSLIFDINETENNQIDMNTLMFLCSLSYQQPNLFAQFPIDDIVNFVIKNAEILLEPNLENTLSVVYLIHFLFNICLLPTNLDYVCNTFLQKIIECKATKIESILYLTFIISVLTSPTLQFIMTGLLIKYDWNSNLLTMLNYENTVNNILLSITYIYIYQLNLLNKQNAPIIDEIILTENPFEISFTGCFTANQINHNLLSMLYSTYTPSNNSNYSIEIVKLLNRSGRILITNERYTEKRSIKISEFLCKLCETMPEPKNHTLPLPPTVNPIAFSHLPDYQQSLVLYHTLPKLPSNIEITPPMRRVLFHQPNWAACFLENPRELLLLTEHYLFLYPLISQLEQMKDETEDVTPEDVTLLQFCQPELFAKIIEIYITEGNSLIKEIIHEMANNLTSLLAIVDIITNDVFVHNPTKILDLVYLLIDNNEFQNIFVEMLASPLISIAAILIQRKDYQNAFRGIKIFLKMNLYSTSLIQLLTLMLFDSPFEYMKEILIVFASLPKEKLEDVSNYIELSFDSFMKRFDVRNFELLQLYLKNFQFIVRSRHSYLHTLLRNLLHDYQSISLPSIGTLFDVLCPPRTNSLSIKASSSNSSNLTAMTNNQPNNKNLDENNILNIPPILKSQSPEFWKIVEENQSLLSRLIEERNSRLNKELKFLTAYPETLLFQPRMKFFRAMQNRKILPGSFHLNVTREKILEDSFKALLSSPKDTILQTFKIKFVGERGIDAGGLTREWFTSLVNELFNPNYALFSPSSNGRSNRPNPSSYVNPDHIAFFRFAGRIIARALIEGIPVSAHFSRGFLKQILGLPNTISDIEDADEELHRSFVWILNNDINELEMTFTADFDDMGNHKLIELKPNGANIPVTNDNKEEYIQLMVKHILVSSISTQTRAFIDGFYMLIPHNEIKMFNPDELNLLICGIPEIDIEDFKANCKYSHPYNAMHKTIKFFFNVVSRWNMENRAKLLLFITGTSQVPIGGFKALEETGRPIMIEYGGNNTRFPVAHTCTNTLDLPTYENEEEMERKLIFAIEECNNFGIY